MMLARVADALYWLGRYLERAENVTRLLHVTSELTVELEGLDETLAQTEWDTLLAAIPGAERARLDFSPAAGLSVPYVGALLLDDANLVSVRHSLGMARENARAIREVLTREVFQQLNEAWRELERHGRRPPRDPAAALDIVNQTQQAILTTLGAIEHTLSRDQGWTFMKLGEALERTLRTGLVLRAKLPALREKEADPPLVYARWRSLLRGVASLENFRRVHGAGLEPDRVLHFLLFDPVAPRSVRCGVTRMKGYLDQLPEASEVSRADRILGRLLAALRYEDQEILAAPDPLPFLDRLISALGETHEAVARQYFLS